MKTFFKVLLGSLIFSVSLFGAYSAIEGNDNPSKVHHFGHWQNKHDTFVMKEGQKEAYFSFNISDQEKIIAKIGYESNFGSLEVTLLDEYQNNIEKSSRVVGPNYTRFIYVKADGDYMNSRYFLKVTRSGDLNKKLFIPINFENRISSRSETFVFSGVASNKGNVMNNYDGSLSNEINLDLRHNNSIPNGAIVTSVSTNSNMNPYQGNVNHNLNVNFSWYSSLANNANAGMYSISERDNIEVKNVWRFRYKTMALNPSRMTNVRLNVSYTLDITETPGY